MNSWELLEDTRWDIINSLGNEPLTMAELSEQTGTSVANISQHLKLLEAYGYVSKKKKDSNGKPGKPTNVYNLNKDFSMIAFAAPGVVGKKFLELPDPYHKMIISIMLLPNMNDHYFLHKLLWQNEEFLHKCKAINYLRSDSEKIELFVVTDYLKEIRDTFSNVVVKSPEGKEKKIVCWSHNESEVYEGLDNNDDYYNELVKNFRVVYDPDNLMQRWQHGK